MIEVTSKSYYEYTDNVWCWDVQFNIDGLPARKYIYELPGTATDNDIQGYLEARYDELAETARADIKRQYRISFIRGVTPNQIDNYIDNNVTNLLEAKEFLKKLCRVVLLIAKETRLET